MVILFLALALFQIVYGDDINMDFGVLAIMHLYKLK